MQIRVHREARDGERRVAVVPREVKQLIEAGHQVLMPAGAGTAAGFPDSEYEAAGAKVFSGEPPAADVLLGIGPLTAGDAAGADTVIALLDPLGSPGEIDAFARAGITAHAMELVPRTTLAQTMDVLSSQATAAGYEAVLVGAHALPRFLPMMMTAAGTIRPGKVLVLGAGVAGLQAIATARRLGAIVSGYDIRPAAREQVESLGARFVGGPVAESAETAGGYAGEVDEETRELQQEALTRAVAEADIVITTAQVPGGRAPILVTREMIESMRPGSVIVDLAAASGGNTDLTRADETVTHQGVDIIGRTDLPSATAGDASEMYSRNIVALLEHIAANEPSDEIVSGSCVTRDGQIVNERVRSLMGSDA